ncbi:MAG TPA: hypothetical protein VL048_00595 [Xanthobacteraceae bacterium]|nr:hypothetical protein [Xanthobacteraceae bacterium]
MTSLVQVNTIFANLKWIILTAVLICVLLFVPDQVRELYRVTAAEDGFDIARSLSFFAVTEFLSLLIIALTLWFGAILIAAETAAYLPIPASRSAHELLRTLPSIVGAAPLLAAAAAQFLSRPEKVDFPMRVGSIIRIEDLLLQSVTNRLTVYGLLLCVGALIFTVVTWKIYPKIISIAPSINANYFGRHVFLVASIAAIISVTTIVFLSPINIPQWIGPFFILAAFTLCVTAVGIHLSLYAIKYHFPFIPIIILYALAIAAFDVNDDYYIRQIDPPAGQPTSAPNMMAAGPAFLEWLKDRPQKPGSTGTAASLPYPVFIIAAEGGGIYAAYNAAVFLSRMQDMCPDFHNHVFAISGVSGGSVGAATFVAALHATGAAKPSNSFDDPCPAISKFLSGAYGLKIGPGAVERKIDMALGHDFLSPLIAAALFPNFSQWFIPFHIRAFDRARALEYALEDATDGFYSSSSSSVGTQNILRTAIEDYWKPDQSLPALLLNATDTGSGKRIIMAPFRVAAEAWSEGDCDLVPEKGIARIPLSTAAFISARFPWVSPAASTTIVNACESDKRVAKIRLADGGYVDNSGIETALDLIDAIKAAAADAKTGDSFRTYLISLSGGDYPDVRVYSFGDIVEPIRALLNGREARAYIALDRAKTELATASPAQGAASTATTASPPQPTADQNADLPKFAESKLRNYFYPLPLGWAMSSKTREIVAFESGRFWDCEMKPDFTQSEKYGNNADCIQLEVYNLLNNSGLTTLRDLATRQQVSEQVDKINRPAARPFLDHQTLMACYESDWWEKHHAGWSKYLSRFQADPLDALLSEWDRRGGPASIDIHTLAYILGSISEDSADFERTNDDLVVKSITQLPPAWKSRIDAINDANAKKTPPIAPIDLSSLMNNRTALAEAIWGYNGNEFGNNTRGGSYNPALQESWKYRERGLYQLIGYDQYKLEAGWIAAEKPAFINILDNPDALSNWTVSARVAFSHFLHWRSPGLSGDDARTALRRAKGLYKKSLAQVLETNPDDYIGARLNQTDMGAGRDATEKTVMQDATEADQRSEMFLRCINEALSPAARKGP